MDIETAINIWSGESFAQINKYMIDRQSVPPTLIYDGREYKIQQVINTLKNNMHSMKKIKKQLETDTFYRGGTGKLNNALSYIKPNFVSVSTEIETALAYTHNNCCLFRYTIDNDVYGIQIGTEHEVLIEQNCYFKFKRQSKIKVNGHEYNIYDFEIKPFTDNIPFYGELRTKSPKSSKSSKSPKSPKSPKSSKSSKSPKSPKQFIPDDDLLIFDEINEEEGGIITSNARFRELLDHQLYDYTDKLWEKYRLKYNRSGGTFRRKRTNTMGRFKTRRAQK